MKDVTWESPRHDVVKLWRDAFAGAVEDLDADADVRFVSCHLTLYGGRRREFYSPISVPDVQRLGEVTHVLLLIDDIFDMYLRLAGPGDLFDWRKNLTDHLADAWEAEERPDNSDPDFSEPELSLLTLEAKLKDLATVLTWRRADSILAESIASQLGAQFLSLGIKQMTSVGATWLTTQAEASSWIPTVYLSHPISRPRKQTRSGKSWPGVVAQFNELPLRLFKQTVLPVMPTAIDEFRLLKREKETAETPDEQGMDQEGDEREEKRSQRLLRLPELGPRWPWPAASVSSEQSLYVQPGVDEWPERFRVLNVDDKASTEWEPVRQLISSAPQYPELLRAGPPDSESVLDPLLRSLENSVALEIAFRDHLLVSWMDSLLVFRPVCDTGTFSGGVRAEILHWEIASRLDSRRRLAVVHFEEDLAPFLAELLATPTALKEMDRQGFLLLRVDILREWGRTEDQIRDLSVGVDPKPHMLDAGKFPDPEGAVEDWNRSKVEASRRFVENRLSLVKQRREQLGIWIVRDIRELRNSIGGIASFLKGGPGPGAEWTTQVESRLGVPLDVWVPSLLDETATVSPENAG